MGPIEVEVIDCARDEAARLAEVLRKSQCIWVTGGNTFFLWHHMRQSGITEMIRARINEGALYVGCSAGAKRPHRRMHSIRADGSMSGHAVCAQHRRL